MRYALGAAARVALAAAGAALLGAALAACSPAPPPPKTVAPAGPATIVLAEESVRREQIWDGVVEAANQATMSSQTAGRILELPFDVNDFVHAGDVIVRFTHVEQQSGEHRAQAQIAAAQAAFDQTQANYARIAEIYSRKLIAKAQLDEALAQRDSARAALLAAQAGAREASQLLDYTVVRAPYSGFVTKRYVQVGESVQAGQPLIAGVSLSDLRVNVHVPQSSVAAIRQFRAADVLIDPDGAQRIAAARLTVFPYADPDTHTFSVRLDLPPSEAGKPDIGLYPGMTVKTAFAVGQAQRLLVPASALVQRSEVSAVYALGATQLGLRQVRLGHRYGDRIEVLAGLAAGERIATDPNAAAQWLARFHAARSE